MNKPLSKVRRLKGWLVEHYGLATGKFTVYESKALAEMEIRDAQCECVLKPIKCEVTITNLRMKKTK
jgi:hypothetical protein